MIINPLNVVRLLLASFISISSIYLIEILVSEAELKENIQKLLLNNIFHYNRLEETEETYLDYQKPYNYWEYKLVRSVSLKMAPAVMNGS